METSMKRDEEDSGTYHVTICNKFLVTTTCEIQNYPYESHEILRDWIQRIRKLQAKKINNGTLLLALSAQSCLNYAGGSLNYFPSAFKKGSGKKRPCELLQLCVGNECMLYELEGLKSAPKVLKDFLYDKRTVVVGVGIHQLAAKLQNDYGILFRKCVDLREFAGLEERERSRAGAAEVARAVTGGVMDYVRPKSIAWWQNGHCRAQFSDDLVKHATVEAFLLHHVGTKLSKDFHKL